MILSLRVGYEDGILLGMLLLGAAWLPYVVGLGSGGDLPEYLVRMVALLAGVSVAIVASRLTNSPTFRRVVRLLLFGYAAVLTYGLLVQVPGAFGVSSLRAFDVALRELILNRGKDVGRLTLLADEPSFAAFQLGACAMIAILFGDVVRPLLRWYVVIIAVVALVACKSITALGVLVMVVGALVLGIHARALRWGVVCLGGVAALVATLVVMQSNSDLAYDPVARVAAASADKSINARWFLFKSTWVGGAESGYLGLGPGQYARRWNDFVDLDPQILANLPERLEVSLFTEGKVKPFSLLGGIFAEFGTATFLGLVSVFVVLAARYRAEPPSTRRPAWVAIGLIVISFLSAYPLSLPDMWLLLGLLVANVRLRRGAPALGDVT